MDTPAATRRGFRGVWGMSIAPHGNLTITLLHRNQFSTLRLPGSVPRRVVRPRHVHLADRARVAPPAEHCRRGADLADVRHVNGWPYDVAGPFDADTATATPLPPAGPGARIDIWA